MGAPLVLFAQANSNVTELLSSAARGLTEQYSQVFLSMGESLYMSFALIIIVWTGVQIALSGDVNMNQIAKLVLVLAFGKAMVSDFHGGEWSITSLVMRQADHMAEQVDRHAMVQIASAVERGQQAAAQNFGGSLLHLTDAINYAVIILGWSLLQLVAWFVVSFADIAILVCITLGPMFVPFFIAPKLDWLFWGWLKAFMQFAFYKVIATIVISVVGAAVMTLSFPPPGQTRLSFFEFLPQLMLALSATAVLLKVPSLTSHIFSGSAGSDSGLLGMAQSATRSAVMGAAALG
jgi:hypothetical protein